MMRKRGVLRNFEEGKGKGRSETFPPFLNQCYLTSVSTFPFPHPTFFFFTHLNLCFLVISCYLPQTPACVPSHICPSAFSAHSTHPLLIYLASEVTVIRQVPAANTSRRLKADQNLCPQTAFPTSYHHFLCLGLELPAPDIVASKKEMMKETQR